MSEIATEKVRLLEILEGDGRICVPRYQRSYSWDVDTTAELWEDILTIVFEHNREHFAGALIFCDSADSSSLEVVDGQQRLISLTILLRAMYDNLKPGTSLAEDIYDHIERGRYEASRYFKLTLGETDQDFFKAFIQEKDRPAKGRRGKNKSHKLIVKAYLYFDSKIKELIKERGRDSNLILGELFKKLKQKLITVRIKVASEVDAYTIFETINSKKVDLTVSDLLKNYIFSSAHQVGVDQLETVRRDWNLMVEALGQDAEISQYVRHYWISAYERSRDKDLYRKIKEYFKKIPPKLLEFSSMLSKEAALYSLIINPQEDNPSRDVYELILDISALRVRQCYPLILAALAKKIHSRELQKLLQKIIAVSLRRSIVEKNPNEVETYYAIAAKQIRANDLASVKGIINKLDDYNPKNKEVANYLEENSISEGVAKFILLRREKSLSTEEKIVFRPTLEHILPKTPERLDDWGVTQTEHAVYVGKLGNLTLVGRKFNSVMSNKIYNKKREELLKSEMKIANEIAKTYRSWGKKEIDKRGEDLLKFIFEIWP